ncbi:chemotaxis protein CheD [Marimonas sp. MJW-29]|uniref:Probable chemoreceptor glutamine deamidase CheD n=1 Tax=Sulfitobacter sediminis TaxID=3234186 RepID=A0ABV3RSC8_9RHOB
MKRIVITQGEHCTSADPDATISTLLGSCVACCLWDPVARVGGMNHMLLAVHPKGGIQSESLSGVNAMELLINDLLKLGAMRHRLMAKAFGGARMISGLSDIGPANCAFAKAYLEREGIECVSESLGGELARHVVFVPTTGVARVKVQRGAPEIAPVVPTPVGNGLELF